MTQIQRKPVNHARDHLPGGADPIPWPNQDFEPPGLVSLWPLDKLDAVGTTVARDTEGVNDGTYFGGSTVTGPHGLEEKGVPLPPIKTKKNLESGYFFNDPTDDAGFSGGGSDGNGNIKITGATGLGGGSPFSAGAWLRVRAPSPHFPSSTLQLDQVLLGCRASYPSVGGWELWLRALGDVGAGQRLVFLRGTDQVESYSVIDYDTWEWVAAVWDGDHMTIYRAGVPIARAGTAGATGSGGPFKIGCGDHNTALGGGFRYLYGALAYAFVAGPMTDDEVWQLYQSYIADPGADGPALPSSALVPGPEGAVVVTDGGTATWELIRNKNVADDAELAVAKLHEGTNGQVLTTVAGVPAWATPSSGTAGGGTAAMKAREGSGTTFTRSRLQFNDTGEINMTVGDDSTDDEIDISAALGTVPLGKLELTGAVEGEVLKISSGSAQWVTVGGADVSARKEAGTTYTRSRLSFGDSAEVVMTVADDSSSGEIDISAALGTVPLSKLSLTGGSEGEVLTVKSGTASWEAAAAGAVGGATDVQVFTAGGTWTKPSGAKVIKMITIGPGGGGGGGRGDVNAAAKGSGAGGGAGAFAEAIYEASTVPSTLTITVGAAGAGGTAGASSSGGAGGNGGLTKVAGAGGQVFCQAGGGGGGAAGTTSAGQGGAGGTSFGTSAVLNAGGLPGNGGNETTGNGNGTPGYGISGAGPATGTPAGGVAEKGGAGGANGSVGGLNAIGGSALQGAGAGGAGGGTTATPATSAATAGGTTGSYARGGGGAAGNSGGSPTPGTAGVPVTHCGSGGGGGGTGTGTAAGQKGGDGGNYGGGGGGGGAGVTTGGAGGKGGDSVVVMIAW